jgi:hypothetical protein
MQPERVIPTSSTLAAGDREETSVFCSEYTEISTSVYCQKHSNVHTAAEHYYVSGNGPLLTDSA